MLYVHGLGHFHPENVIDNAFLESLDIGTTEEWIMSRVGIEQRRTVLPLDYLRETKNADPRAAEEAVEFTNAQTGARAAEMAIERAGIDKQDVGLVLSGGCSPQWSVPAEASMVAKELELEVPAFDMHAACSTFGLHLHYLSKMGDAVPDYVLCLCIENNTRVIDYRDRSGCVLWGDGSSAAIVSTKHEGRAQVLSSSFGGSPAGALDVTVPRYGFFAQNGSKVQKFAIKRMVALLAESKAVPGTNPDELVYIGHQANLTMLRSVAKRGAVAEGYHWYNIREYGNQGSAGAPNVLSQRWDEVPSGQRVATIVVGSGLSWSRCLLAFR
jgi:3-oxoacyl-[acyl-carrier-protein] synthase III